MNVSAFPWQGLACATPSTTTGFGGHDCWPVTVHADRIAIDTSADSSERMDGRVRETPWPQGLGDRSAQGRQRRPFPISARARLSRPRRRASAAICASRSPAAHLQASGSTRRSAIRTIQRRGVRPSSGRRVTAARWPSHTTTTSVPGGGSGSGLGDRAPSATIARASLAGKLPSGRGTAVSGTFTPASPARPPGAVSAHNLPPTRGSFAPAPTPPGWRPANPRSRDRCPGPAGARSPAPAPPGARAASAALPAPPGEPPASPSPGLLLVEDPILAGPPPAQPLLLSLPVDLDHRVAFVQGERHHLTPLAISSLHPAADAPTHRWLTASAATRTGMITYR